MELHEINRLVAEKVMGWKRVYDNVNERHVWETGDGIRTLFYPAESIEYAWEVVEKIDCVHFSIHKIDNDYITHFDEVHAESETAPLAICGAALTSIGIKLEESE